MARSSRLLWCIEVSALPLDAAAPSCGALLFIEAVKARFKTTATGAEFFSEKWAVPRMVNELTIAGQRLGGGAFWRSDVVKALLATLVIAAVRGGGRLQEPCRDRRQ